MENSESYLLQPPLAEEGSQQNNQSTNCFEEIKALVEAVEKLIKKKNKSRSIIARKEEKQKSQLTVKICNLRRSNIRWLIDVRRRELWNFQRCLVLLPGQERHRRHKISAKYSPIGDSVVSDMKESYPFSPGNSYSELREWSYKMIGLEGILKEIRRDNNYSNSQEEFIEPISNKPYRRLRHGCKSQAEERKHLREFKLAEWSEIEPKKEPFRTTYHYTYSVPDYLGSKDDIIDRIQLIHREAKGLNRENQVISRNIKILEGELKSVESEILSQRRKIANIERAKEKAYASIYKLREKGAKQVDKLISQWKISGIFGFEYERNKPET